MTVPTYEELMAPLLQYLAERNEAVSLKDAVEVLGKRLHLTQEDMSVLLPSGKQTTISNRTSWARFFLQKAGYLEDGIKRGYMCVAPAGIALSQKMPPQLDRVFLEGQPKFKEWLDSTKSSLPREEKGPMAPAIKLDARSPDEIMGDIALQLNTELQKELLATILANSPAFFEKLIVDLLIGMGYGGGRSEMGRAIGKVNDGGIDGVIDEDKLGLDVIYIQAKRYGPDNKIGRETIQAFVGSLAGHKATKGVFVTTSSFTSSAWDYIKQIDKRVVLIDGGTLTKYMLDHDVGVRIKDVYQIKKIDEDYFEDL